MAASISTNEFLLASHTPENGTRDTLLKQLTRQRLKQVGNKAHHSKLKTQQKKYRSSSVSCITHLSFFTFVVLQTAKLSVYLLFSVDHWSQTPFLEGNSSAQFSFNSNQTLLIQLIKVFTIARNLQAGVILS